MVREMGMKDKKKTHKNKKLAQRNLELVEKDIKLDKNLEMRKRKRVKENNGDSGKEVQISVEVDNSAKAAKDKKKEKLPRKGNIKKVKDDNASDGKHDHHNTETDDGFDERNDDGAADQSQFGTLEEMASAEVLNEAGKSLKARKKKNKGRNSLEGGKPVKKGVEAGQNELTHFFSADEDSSKGIASISIKPSKKKKKGLDSSKPKKSMEKEGEAEKNDVYLISSGDDDSSTGMKKWITEYHQSRPGLKVLQQRIDEFIIAHEAKLEREKKEREARSAEGGWTVVVHHKGRKKTTDADSGITVGSVAQAAVEDKVAKKKKSTDVGLDFYRFQRKEAKRDEILMLQRKFEQDKKRIQQLRAARKFRPY